MIKLRCSNNQCYFNYEVSQKELEEYPNYHTYCLICGAKLQITNLEEIVEKDLYSRAEEYLNKWIAEMGLEGCIEMVERNREQGCYRIYKELLEKRGFKIK